MAVGSELKELVIVTDPGIAFNLFSYESVLQLINFSQDDKQINNILDKMYSVLQSTSELSQRLTTSSSFSKFIVTIIEKADSQSISKLLKILRHILDNN